MTDVHALLDQLAEQTSIALDAARGGDAAGVTATLEAREALVSQLTGAMAQVQAEARREAEARVGSLLALDRELNELLHTLQDATREAIQATRAARAAANNPNRAPAPARFVSQRA